MSRLQKTREVLDALDASRSSTSSLDPTLSTLSPEDVEVLDAIIFRVPDATAFMTVFKAYSEVLRERGLDPGNDVVYYKQLLKLGVIRGANWGTKWFTVKSQLGYVKNGVAIREPKRKMSSSRVARLDEDDVFTSPSHLDETETAVDLEQIALDHASHRQGLIHPRVHLNNSTSQTVSTATRQRNIPSILRFRVESPMALISDDKNTPLLSPQPPQWHRYRVSPDVGTDKMPLDLRGKPSTHLNERDVWRNIERSRHIEDADRFRKESLLTTCFHAWKAGLDWINSTHTQIDHARNQVQLQVYFSRWKTRKVVEWRSARQAMAVREIKLQQAVFQHWRIKAGHHATIRWEEKMRTNILHFRRREDRRIRNEAWMRWRQLYMSRQVYIKNTLYGAVQRWKAKLKTVDDLDALAYHFDDARMLRVIRNTFETWYRRVQLRDAESYFLRQKSKSLLSTTLGIWARKFRDNHEANALHAKFLTKQTFKTWQKVLENKELLVSRSDKYIKRRHHLLIRAVIRVWIARERGRLLDRVRAARLMRSAFSLWNQKVAEHGCLRSQAISFSQHSATRTLASMFHTWNLRKNMVANQAHLASDWYSGILLYQTLLIWRLQLRARLRLLHKTKIARRLFVERDAWNKWHLALAKKRLERKAQVLLDESLRRVFINWLCKLRQRRYEVQAIQLFERRSQRHLLRQSMQHWTDRIVFVKLRALGIAEQTDRDCLSRVFARWRWAFRQHAESLSLLDSFQVVKREDTMRRMFMKWSALARKARIRGIRLATHENELRVEILTTAWETWRNRFREIGLQDLEYQVIIQNQRSTLHHAFLIWRSQSKSVPAVRQYSNSLKFKIWHMWRKAFPLAKQIRLAQEAHAKRLLAMIFEKWKQAHRTKVALKAVARARHLRLPSPGYKPSSTSPKSRDSEDPRPVLHLPRRPYVLEPSKDDDDTVPNPRAVSLSSGPNAISRRERLSSLLSRPSTSNANTTPESSNEWTKFTADGNRRDKLWNELRGARLHNDNERVNSK
ncbi:hypothetical protein BU17DRAFT_44917 [Hysterangium stoloniferum]|nr:hypothetical protein BU17DRAFT_44917 [Hysterangium stoloniferum]